MTTSLKFIAPLALLGLVLGGCQPDIEAPAAASAGSANFATYIAVGNSLTAGYQSGGVSRAGQLQSYPSILATQFALVGGGAFNQPLFSEAQADGSGYAKLLVVNGALTPVQPSLANQYLNERLAVVGIGVDTKTRLLAKYTGTDNQNLGIPGIKVADITTNGYGYNNPAGFNPYFERLLPSTLPQGLTSYLQYVGERVRTLKPTFFTNWLGNNDVLLYASDGGASGSLTPVTSFTPKYKQMLDTLTAKGAKGLVATIPNVTNVPLFTTVTTALVKAGIKSNPLIPNASTASLYIRTGAGAIREATDADLLLLTARAVIGTPGMGGNPLPVGVGYAPSATASNPLPSEYVLDADEVRDVVTRTAELNTVIRAEASSRNLALFDANAFFSTVATNGVATNGINNTTTYVSGNLFSLDGVHPTPRGYAIIANEMLKAINAQYGSTFRGVNANSYPGTLFPGL